MVKATSRSTLVRYRYIDALRGWAIIGVLLAHVSIVGSIHYPGWLLQLTYISIGPRGVQLFFVVSAFTLFLSWTKRENKEKHVVKNFYIRRFFRIAPLFYIAIMYFLFIQNYWNGNPNHYSIVNILSTFLFLNGAFPAWINNIVYGGWTITVEMMFYFLFPFLVGSIRTIRRAVIVTFATMITAQILRLSLNTIPVLSHTYSTFTFEFFPSQFPVFLVGITTFLLLQNPLTKKDKKFLQYFSLFFMCLLLLQFSLKIPFIAGHYVYGVFFGVLVYILSIRPTRWLVNSITIHIGKVSYSIYLSHVAILWMMEKYHLVNFFPHYPILNFSLVFLLVLFFSTTFSTVTYYLIERPGQQIGKKIIDFYEKKPTTDINTAVQTW